MIRKDVSIKSAAIRLKKLFPGQYSLAVTDASNFKHREDIIYRKRVYAEIPGWSDECVTYEEAIQNLLEKQKEKENASKI